MKSMKLVAFVMTLGLTLGASAQNFTTIQEALQNEELEISNTNIDETGQRIRGSYLTNPWYSNWSVALMGGVQTLVSGTKEHNAGFDLNTSRITPSLELTVTKWFTPVIGLRAGFQGFWLEENFKLPTNQSAYNHYIPKHDEGTDHNYYTETFIHGDIMWNFVNTFWGYRANRFYNIIPYAQFGLMRLCHPDYPLFSTGHRDIEFEIGFGLFNSFRISNSFQAVLDLRWGNLDGRYHDVRDGSRVNHLSAQVGIAYNIEKWYFTRAKFIEEQRDVAKADAVTAMAALNEVVAQNETLQEEVEQAKTNLEEVEKLSEELFKERLDAAGLVVYYEINISKLNFSEMHHLDEYVRTTLQRNPKHVFYLTGSADEGTGNFAINTRLSHERANGVREILLNKYGVPEDQIVIKATIISSAHEDGGLDRCVLLENK